MTVIPNYDPRNLALHAPCDMCGAPEGVLIFDNGHVSEHQCRECARRHAVYTAAYDNLELLIRQAVKAWLPQWGDLPGIVDLGEQLGQIGFKLREEARAGKL